MKYYLEALKKYAVFDGRASMAEYWYFVLFNILVSIAVGIVAAILQDKSDAISRLYSLVLIVPSIAIAVRRLHDIGKSGWWWFICFIPIVGWIWIIILLTTESNHGKNKYGPHPRETKVKKI
jgi:uncharacterized membrane protein YhaH (DUF805 family)